MRRSIVPLALLSCFVLACPTPASAGESGGDVVLQIGGVTDDPQGVVRCGLYTKSSWLEPEDAIQWVDATYTDDGGASCVFEDVDPGTYGVGVFHDADADHDMDSNFLGIPSEGVCASNDPGANMGPPKFEGAKFQHGDERTEVACTMNY
jgi:uncharacterized protein (DUF2141 family)